MIKKFLLPVFVAAIVLPGCTIEKRHFRPGYHLEWKSHAWSPQPGAEVVPPTSKLENNLPPVPTAQDNPIKPAETATKEEMREPDKESLSFLVSPGFPQEDSCDLVTKMNGDEIRARVTKITENIIEYKRCDIPDGPVYVEKKSAVFMIKFQNGTKEVFAKTQNESGENGDRPLGALAPLSILFALITVLCAAADSPVFFVALLLSLMLGIIGLVQYRDFPEKYSRAARAMSIFAIVICGVALVVILAAML